MKQRFLVTASLIILSTQSLFAVTSHFRTPLSFEQKPRTYVHYPTLQELESCSNWLIDGFGVYYQRNACCAFGCDTSCNPCNNLCTSNKVTSHTVPLAQLWFGKSSFLVADAFANGVITVPTGNPFLNFVTLTPRFSYNERGAFVGITVHRYNLGCDGEWFVKGRIGLPISVVEVNQRQGNPFDCTPINPDFANTIVNIQQEIQGNGSTSGAIDTKTVGVYRLDLLSSLMLPDGTPMVQYGTITPGSTAGNTRIAGQDITNNEAQVIQQTGSPFLRGPIYMYKQSSGMVPFAPNGLTQVEVASAPPLGQNLMRSNDSNLVLPADGLTNFPDGQWAVFGGQSLPPFTTFNEQEDYAGNLGTNPAAQRQLFLAPVWEPSGAGWEEIGLVVEDTITRVIQDLENAQVTPLTFLCLKGIDFNRSECLSGAGDLFIDIWGGKQNACWFADGLIGFRVPSGARVRDPRRIFAQPNGSNGHFAFKLGAEGGYMVCDWIGLKLEMFFNHFFKATEKRAAIFQNALIRNIGPCVDARISWNTFILYLDATFFSLRCPNLGWDFGYEFYAKSKDDFCYCVSELADFTGVIQPLDNCLARQNTDTQTHKVRLEVFNQWGCFQIFFGGSYILAGKNAMKETEWHLGMKAEF